MKACSMEGWQVEMEEPPPYLRLGANCRWASKLERDESDWLAGGVPEIAKGYACACDWSTACRRCEPSALLALTGQGGHLIGLKLTTGTSSQRRTLNRCRPPPAGVCTLTHPCPEVSA